MTETGPKRSRLVTSIVLQSLAATALVATPVPVRDVIDGLGRGESFSFFLVRALAILGLGIAAALLQFAADRAAFAAGYQAVRRTQNAVYERLLRMPLLFFTTAKPGALSSRITNDVSGMEAYYSSVVPTVVAGVVGLGLSSIVLVVLNPLLLIVLAIVPLCLIPIRIAERRIDADIAATFEITRDLSSAAGSTLTTEGVTLTRQSGRTVDEVERFGRLTDALAGVSLRTAAWRSSVGLVYGVLFTVVTAGVVILAAWLASIGTMSPGDLVLALIYSLQIRGPVTAIIGTRYPLLRARITRDRVGAVLDWTEPPTATATEPVGEAALSLRGIRYRYPDAATYSIPGLSHTGDSVSIGWLPLALLDGPSETTTTAERGTVLDGIDVDVRRGETVAVVGGSGAGKSTLAAIAVGLLSPDAGRVALGGVPIDTLSEAERAERIAYISQDTHVLHGSIRDNLLYGAPGAEDAALREACVVARFDAVVDALPEGLDTIVGERGHRLSGGERQRLAVARAVLRRPSVIVLDEPTAHLDTRTEAELKAALRSALSDFAVLMIAHRLSTIQDADRIVVLEHGRISESGRHDELLARRGPYARLLAAEAQEDA